MAKSPRSAGRPENAGMSADSIKNKITHELTKANKNAANNLGKYFQILESYAMGKGSDTNTVSSCKYFIEMAQGYLEEQAVAEAESVEDTVVEEETKQVGNGEVVSNKTYQEKLAEWNAKKAGNKEQEG